MYKKYLIGNAHLDPAWLWTWQEGYAEVKSTFQAALDRLGEYEDFVFTCSSASYYKWIEESEPEMFEKIRKYVHDGRWCIVGGWLIQADCNMLSGESFARQALHGQRYYQNKFGKICKTGYNVDSFGHNGNLPQILKKSGMDNYVFKRPQEHEKHMDKSLFWWESNDDSKVLAFRIPYEYQTATLDILKEKQNKMDELLQKEQIPAMLFYGVGNHGGGPTIEMLDYLTETNDENSVFSSVDQYFEDAKKVNANIYKGDLQHHASGCYSAHSEMKRLNRQAENKLVNTEKYSVMANKIAGIKYEKEKINSAWENVLFNQFHDIICGCSIPKVHEDAKLLYGESLSVLSKIANFAVQGISYKIDTLKGVLAKNAPEELGRPIVVFNPLAWEVNVPVRIRCLCYLERGDTGINSNTNYGAFDSEGNMVNIVHIKSDQLLWKPVDGLFEAKVPAFGYKLYYIKQIKNENVENKKIGYKIEDSVIKDSIATEYGNYVLENNFIKVEIDRISGGIKQIHDKTNMKDVFSQISGIGLVMDDWENDTWGHNQNIYRNCVGKFGNAKVRFVENNSIRCVVRSKTNYEKSELVQDFILYKNSKELEVLVRVNWQEKHKMLKLSFNTNLQNTTAFYEIPYTYIEKSSNGEEEVALNWVDVVGENENRKYGVAILNDSKYSFSVKDNELQMMVARSAIYADHGGVRLEDEDYQYLDIGCQEFKYVIKPHIGDFRQTDIIKKSIELNTEFEIVNESYHNGNFSDEGSFVNIDKDNIIVAAIKRSEDDDGYILRAYEVDGQPTVCKLKLFEDSMTISFGANEIKTIKIMDNGNVIETNFLEFNE